MFEFVNSTSTTFDQDDDIKRKIRSHAMKDYRARQRQERSGRKKQDDRDAVPTQRPSRLTFRLVVNSNGTSEKEEDNIDPALRVNREGSTPLSISPSAWGNETPDIFTSPAQLQQMFGLCREWFQWLRPDIKADFAGKPIDVAWELAPCPMLLAANCLAAVGGLDAADRNRPSGLEVVFKGRVLREVQLRMASSLAATTDETMSTLLFLVSYEFYRLNPEALTHLKGLRSILRLKGQHRAGMRWGGGMVLETLDLLTALWQNTDPLMTPVEDDGDEKSNPPKMALQSKYHRAAAAREAFKSIADTLTVEQTRTDSHGDEESSKDPIPDFVGLLDVCNEILHTFWEGLDTAVADDYFERLNAFSSANCECEPDKETQSALTARVIHQTFAIFYNAITNRNPFQHHTNQSYVNGVIQSLISIEERTWKPAPYLRYLVLLTGASAAKQPSDKSFFHTHLGKCQMVLGIAKWPEAKRFIVNFLRYRRGIDPKSNKVDKRKAKYKERLEAAGAEDAPEGLARPDVIPVDDVLGYRSLSWCGQNPNTGLEEMLTDDRTFHEAMLSGAFWKTE